MTSFLQHINDEDHSLLGRKIGSITITPRTAIEFWDGNFWCDIRNLKSLKGAPHEIGGDFNCSHNNLQTLKYGPRVVHGTYICNGNPLISLEGAPVACDHFDCGFHTKFTSLAGVHNQLKSIHGKFKCTSTFLKSHVLGLLLIKNIQSVELFNDTITKILNKNIGKGRKGVIDAQNELIDAGFEEYAEI